MPIDVISVDCGVLKNEYYGDSAYTFGVVVLKPEIQKLLDVLLLNTKNFEMNLLENTFS